jgi:DNA-directed RNA polymerase I subunit RPA43
VREWDVRGGKGKGVLRVEGSLLSVEEEKGRAERRKGKRAVD